MTFLEPVNIKYFKLVVQDIKKDTSTEVQANCPICSDKKYRLHLYRPKGFDQDVVHCFNSGCILEEKHHNMINFLKIAKPDLVENYKRENLKTLIKSIENTNSISTIVEEIEKNTGIKQTEQNDKKRELPLDKLFMKCKDSEVCKSYVKHRGFQPREDWYFSVNKFFTYNSKTVFLENYLIIPIYLKGKYKGFYSRSIKEKKFSTFLLPGVEKIWISKPELNPFDIEIITEGIFDALSSGFENSAAMLSASLSEEYLNSLNKNCIFALDNDPTGIKKAIEYAERGFKIFVAPEDWNYKDFNDPVIDKEKIPKEIKEIIEQNTYQGIDAIVRLKMKEI